MTIQEAVERKLAMDAAMGAGMTNEEREAAHALAEALER